MAFRESRRPVQLLRVATLVGSALFGAALEARAQQGASNACTPDLEALFRVAETSSHGVWVTDQASAIGGAVPDEKFVSGLLNAFTPNRGWYPVDGTKRVVCGTLTRWSMFRGPGAERDLHPHMLPLPDFLTAVDDLPPYATADKGGEIFGEVTPPSWLRPFWATDNRELTRGDNACGQDNGSENACKAQQWVDEVACMYGPWVMEKMYDYRVEIHPAQVLWGRHADGIRIFVLEDSSGRFDQQRSYRRQITTVPWKPWGAPRVPTVWVAVNVLLGNRAELTVKRGALNGDEIREDSATAITFGAGVVNVKHSSDLQIGRGPACRTASGRALGFVSVTSRSPSTLRVVDVSGDVLQSRPAAVGPDERAAPHPNEREEKLTLQVSSIEWREPFSLGKQVGLERTRSEWGFASDDTVEWTTARTQRLRLRIAAEEPSKQGRYWADWGVQVCRVEDPGECYASVPDDMYLEVAHGARVAVTVPDGVQEKRHAAPTEMLFYVRNPTPRSNGPVRLVESRRVVITVTLRDAEGAQSTSKYTLNNLAPDFAADVQGYDVEMEGGIVPEKLLMFAAGWLSRAEGLPVSRQTLERDWDLSVTAPGDVIGPFAVQGRRRHARTLRLALLAFMEDRAIDAKELRDTFELLERYRRASRDNAVPTPE